MPANTRARRLENSEEPRKLGLRRVYPPPGDDSIKTEVDIVAIHGLDTHSPTTWEAWKDGDHRLKVHWLQDKEMLPSVIKNARIFTYDWNASYDKHSSSASLLGMADGLLERLRIQRSKDENKRPIVFVGSCFGGLLLIKALHRAYEVPGYRDIFEFTVGAVFLGTPFQGSDQSFYSAAQQRLVVALSAGGEVSNQMVEYLNNSDGKRGELDELVQRFRELHLQEAFKFPMICFYETRETDFTKVIDKLPREYVSCLRGKHKGILVPEHSACFQGLPKLPLEVRHLMLNKYANPEDDAFCVVSFRIKELVDGARKTLQAKGIVSLWESDDWIIKYRYTPDKLRIERLSGNELPMDQCYINLAIVEQQGRSEAQSSEESKRSSRFSLATRLKVEIPNENIRVELPKIFDSRKRHDGNTIQPRRILIRGQAGVGKTTLCKKMVHDFINCRMWTNLFDRILWVPLRSLRTKPDKGYTLEGLFLRDFFFGAPKRNKLARELENALHKSKYSRTLFVFDGLDEISEGLHKDNGMYSFLEFLLRLPNVIITSRPSARLPDHLHADLVLETIGFYPAQITDYLKSILKIPQQVEQVESFLRRNRLVHSLVRIPIQLDAFCFIWDKTLLQKNTTWWTMTTIYVAIEQRLWKKDAHRLRKPPLTVENARPKEMERLIKPIPTILELLAFNGMYHNVVEFHPEYRDIVLEHINLLDHKLTLATVLGNVSFLRTSDPSIEFDERSYHFLHLTYQEFFAAKYFVRCWQDAKEVEYYSDPEDQESRVKTNPKDFLRKFKYSARYDIVWRFAAGLFGRKVWDFIELIGDKPLDLLGPAHQRLIMHCLTETDPSTCSETRLNLETKLSQWVLFECDLSGSSILASERGFPHRALHIALGEGDRSQRLRILSSLLYFHGNLSLETVEYLAKLLKTTDTRVKSAVIKALGNQPGLPDRIVIYLVALLEDPDQAASVISAAAEALQSQSSLSDGAVTKLVGLIKNGTAVSSAAAKALRRQSNLPEGAITTLVGLIGNGAPNSADAAEALENQSSLSDGAVSTLVGLIRNNATAKDVAATARALENPLNLAEETATTLEALLSNADKCAGGGADIGRIRRAAGAALEGQSSLSERSITTLVTLVKFADDQTKRCAADILERQSNFSEQIAAALVSLFRDRQGDCDQNWVHAFDALKYRDDLPQQTVHSLLQLLENGHWVVREYAAEILADQSKLSDEAETALTTLVGNSNASIRYTTAIALNQQSNLSEQTVKDLLQLLQNENPSLRAHASKALSCQSKLSDKTIAALIQILGGTNRKFRVEAARVIMGQSNLSTNTIHALIALPKDESGAVNPQAVEILGSRSWLPKGAAAAAVGVLRKAGPSRIGAFYLGLKKEWDLSQSDIQVITEFLEAELENECNRPQRSVTTLQMGTNGGLSAIIRALGSQSNLPKRTITALVALTKKHSVQENAAVVLSKQQKLSDEVIAALVSILESWDQRTQFSIYEFLMNRSNWPRNVVNALVPLLGDAANRFAQVTAVRVLEMQLKLSKETAVSVAALLGGGRDFNPRLFREIGTQSTLIDKILEGLEAFSRSEEPAGGRFLSPANKNKRLKTTQSDGSRTALQAIGNLYGRLIFRSLREEFRVQVNEDLTLTFHQPNGSRTTCFSLESLDEIQNLRRRWNPRGYNLY